MYCKKCGYLLVSGENYCRHCKEPVDTAEMCGGFWGLVEEGKINQPTPVVVQKVEEPQVMRQPVEKPSKDELRVNKKFFYGLLGVSAGLLVLTLFFAVINIRMKLNYNNVEAQLEQVQTTETTKDEGNKKKEDQKQEETVTSQDVTNDTGNQERVDDNASSNEADNQDNVDPNVGDTSGADDQSTDGQG